MTHKKRIEAVQGEKITPEFKLVSFLAYTPPFVKTLASAICNLVGQPRMSQLLKLSMPMPTGKFL